jgi:putative tricarboxylic transport membrane protein
LANDVAMQMTSDDAITMRQRYRAALPYLVVFAVGCFLYYSAANFEFEEASGRIGPGAWPKLILLVMLAAALWGIVASALQGGKPGGTLHETAEQDETEALLRPPEIYPSLVWFAIAVTVGYLAIMPFAGFFLSTIVFSFALIFLGHYRRLSHVALLSVAIAFAFMFMFMRVVYVALPVGVAPFDRLSYALMAAMGVH